MALDDSLPQLTEYTVRVSRRARSVNFRVLPLTGLEVTVPRWFPKRDIPGLISENREWIEEQLAKVRSTTPPEFLEWPPTQLNLRAIDTIVSIDYATMATNQKAAPGVPETGTDVSGGTLHGTLTGGSMVVHGASVERKALLRLISALLKQQARQVFAPLVASYAEQHGLSYSRLTVRGQKTLWGSCSATGGISLNYKLLFLPKPLMHYVILHELTHTRHMNHSAQFWKMLSRLDPDAVAHDRELDTAAVLVPPWLEAVS